MAFVHGTRSRLFLNDRQLSCEVKGFSASWERNLAEATALCDSGSKFVPGLTEGSISVEGMFQSDTGASGVNYIHETIQDSIDQDNGSLLSVYPAGLTVGYPAFIQRGDTNSYEVESSVDDIVSLKMEAQSDDSADWGSLLRSVTAETAATSNGTAVDNLALSTNGGAAIIHVTSFTGTSAVVKIQHSVDASTWADLVTFTTATGKTSEFKVVAKGTTVNRHLRTVTTLTSATVDYTVAFARR